MASPAHGFYCLEVLSASFDDTNHPNLESIVGLYEQWQQELSDGIAPEEAASQSTVQVEEQHNRDSGQLQLPLISRLRDLTPSSHSSLSTPSSTSVNSSNTQLTSPTSIHETAPTYASRLSVTDTYPIFVTWNTLSKSGHKSLRGCIGTFEPLPLEEGLKTYALTSAFEDTRFSPIPAQLVPSLSCSLTLLADFEECEAPLDWELGKHGIRISFTHRYRRHGATYLPDVATEQGWTKEQTLESLMRKAGWESQTRRSSRGTSRPWEDVRDFRVVRYTGLKASATYSEWQEWRKWAKKTQPSLWSA